MNFVLKEIAEIQPGFSFRGKIEPRDDGEFQVLQIKDVGAGGELLTDDLIRTGGVSIKSEYLVQRGDVLLTTRGANRRAVFVAGDLPDTIFTAQIFSLRNIDERVSPAYLAWYLNQRQAQEFLITNASGSYIQNIRIDDLSELPVAAPSRAKQEKIVEIDRLYRRERELVGLIQSKRSQIVEQMLAKIIEEE